MENVKLYRPGPVLLSSLLAGLLYATLALFTDVGSVLDGFASIGYGQWAVILSLSVTNYMLRWYRWTWFFRSLGYEARWLRQLFVYLAGFAFTTTPGKVGEAVRMLHLKSDNVRYSDSAAALIAERALDLGAVTLIATLGVVWLPDAAFLVLAVAAVIVVVGVYLLPEARRLLSGFAHRWGTRIGSSLLEGAGSALAALKSILNGRRGFLGLMIGLLAWGAEAYGLYLVLVWLNQPIEPLLAASIYAVAMLAGALSFVPGGLGTAEAAMIAMLALAGVPTTDAVTATLICRAATLWFAVCLGLLCSACLLLFRTNVWAAK